MLGNRHLAEDCPELCADQAVDQQVDRRVDHEEDVGEEPGSIIVLAAFFYFDKGCPTKPILQFLTLF